VASSVATRVAVARTAAPFVPHSNGAWRGGKRAGWIPERSSGWRPDACRSCRPIGLTGHLLCRPSPPPPYRACRPNICRYGSRGKPSAANDVAHIKSAADVELVLSDEVGHIDRVIAGADVIRTEDSASGAAQWCGAGRFTFAREGASTRTDARVDRSIDIIAAVLRSRAGVATLATGMGSLAPSSPRKATSGSTPAISRPLS
jgi:hypothetical protein